MASSRLGHLQTPSPIQTDSGCPPEKQHSSLLLHHRQPSSCSVSCVATFHSAAPVLGLVLFPPPLLPFLESDRRCPLLVTLRLLSLGCSLAETGSPKGQYSGTGHCSLVTTQHTPNRTCRTSSSHSHLGAPPSLFALVRRHPPFQRRSPYRFLLLNLLCD